MLQYIHFFLHEASLLVNLLMLVAVVFFMSLMNLVNSLLSQIISPYIVPRVHKWLDKKLTKSLDKPTNKRKMNR